MAGHLIHIGFPKAGSSYLQLWFRQHPQLRYLHGGIAGFHKVYGLAAEGFTARTARWRVTSTEGLAVPNRDHGGLPDTTAFPTPQEIVAAQERVCDLLKELFPDAHILIVTRGFRGLVLSGYSQYVRVGGEQSVEEHLAPPLPTYPCDYDAMIARYRSAFGDRVIVLPFELLAEDRRAFIATLEARLGLEPSEPPRERVNPALSPVELRWYPRLSRTVRRLPWRGRWLWPLYSRLVAYNHLRWPIRLLDALFPAVPVTQALISDELLRPLCAGAVALMEEPGFAPYRDRYQF